MPHEHRKSSLAHSQAHCSHESTSLCPICSTQVFDLLETIYGAFDKSARRRNVFKIETIGDCYVAATGLPEAQKDHAGIMVKFAADIIRKLRHLIATDLAERLGNDTRELALRVGVHSGPVTAGVLRGDKGRFQVFGDTVNVASRMEVSFRGEHRNRGTNGKISSNRATGKATKSRFPQTRPSSSWLSIELTGSQSVQI